MGCKLKSRLTVSGIIRFHGLCFSPDISRVYRIKEDEVIKACSMHGRDGKLLQIMWCKNWKGRRHLKIILKC